MPGTFGLENSLAPDAVFGVTYGSLAVFAVLAMGAALVIERRSSWKEGFAARRSQHWLSVGVSMFASGMGTWVLLALPEVGTYAGWWGVVGYWLASVLPSLVMFVLAPRVKDEVGEAFSLSDWARERFGRGPQVIVGLVAVFYMWIALVAEFIAIGTIGFAFSGVDRLFFTIPVAIVTTVYTAVGGLSASIWTDWLQAFFVLVFVIIGGSAALYVVNREVGLADITESHTLSLAKVGALTPAGFDSLALLVIAVVAAEMFNMANWQRVYAARDNTHVRRGMLLNVVLITPVCLLLGAVGIAGMAYDNSSEEQWVDWENYNANFIFFHMLDKFDGVVLHTMIFVLAVCLAASSVDSLQNGLASVFVGEFDRRYSENATKWFSRGIVVVFNVFGLVFAAVGTRDTQLSTSIVNLFLVADAVAATAVGPIFMGVFSKRITSNGIVLGWVVGVLSFLMWGWFAYESFLAGTEMLGLMAFGSRVPQEEAGFYAPRSCVVISLSIVTSSATTYFVSTLEHIVDVVTLNTAAIKLAIPDWHPGVAAVDKAGDMAVPLATACEPSGTPDEIAPAVEA